MPAPEAVAVRWGRLAGSMTTPAGADPRPGVETLRATAQVVERPERVGADTSVEETLLLSDWVLEAGARLVDPLSLIYFTQNKHSRFK